MKPLSLCAVLLAVSLGFAQEKSVSSESKAPQVESESAPEKLVPLPRAVPAPMDNPTTPAKVELGKKLFFDPRLSGDNKMSCVTCHIPEKAYGDGLALSPGADGKPLARNTQTCLNVVTFYYRGIPAKDRDDFQLDVEALSGQSFSEISLIVEFLKSLTGKMPIGEPPKIP